MPQRILPYVAFILSGASSLIFQAIWTRMLHHVFGATSVAISSVLSVFMAGLGLGAWIAGKYADRIKHPIITYAVAELVVGAWALVVPFMVPPFMKIRYGCSFWPTFADPLNIMCSNRWANPVRPLRSSRDPALYWTTME